MNPEESTMLRRAVLEALSVRHPAALPAPSIRRRAAMQVDFPFSEGETESALVVLSDLGFVRSQYDSLGSVRYWSATAQGLLEIERGGKR